MSDVVSIVVKTTYILNLLMGLLTTNCRFSFTFNKSRKLHSHRFLGGRDSRICGGHSSPNFSPKLFSGYGDRIRALGGQNQTKKSRKGGKLQKGGNDLLKKEQILDEYDVLEDGNKTISPDNSEILRTSVISPSSRSAVLQACTVTSAFIAALGVLIRQVSHIASEEGLTVVDYSADITFSFELWHLELIMGSVILVSSSRFLLLKIWPDFAESSEAANQQVLTSLEPLDYLAVAFLPGISEELLFRGALLPLFGVNNWTSTFAIAALFGVLHLGSGRKYSFAIWATLVGLVYGYATVLSTSIVVPMASHALNNLVGGIIWRYSSKYSSKQIG